jgi:chromosome segregation ATPase
MADPTGTVGGIHESSFDLAVKGGPSFMDRLRQIEEATDRHDKALARLKVGQDIGAALTDAKAKLAAAEVARKQAAETLADAKAQAEAQAARAEELIATAKASQRELDKRLKDVEAREQAATKANAETNAKAERAQADATRLRDELHGKLGYLSTSLREIGEIAAA